ncbi:hypothetical protein BG006_001928 [Podila minutissima]|uniref:Uncharacterized protein n=1 Tax=Podila minutissima TaxID=64525 RepID=A0A9P5VP75_9FUNG|nr:hypothetical protein BG006_001928 [Podila minutissima]
MNKSARKAVNLSVLQRHDPHITDIIDSSSYVVVYKFDEASQAWTKKGVEGTMFVFKRSTLPSYGFFIMNRLGIDNLMADLKADMALQLTSDYIIYRDEKDIHGIWVYEPTDRDRIGEKLLECCKKATDDPHTSVKPSSSASSGFSAEQQQPHSQKSATSQSPESATMDPLSLMLNAAMSRARVSESSGVPTSAQSNHSDYHHSNSNASTPARPIRTLHEIEQELAAGSSYVARSNVPVDSAILASSQAPEASKETHKNEIPSFLMAIISKDGSNGSQSGSPSSSRTKDESSLLNTLSGNNRSGGPPMSGPPLSAELLPASVMPSGLYGSVPRSNGGQTDGRTRTPSSTVATASLLNRPNGPHQSPLQAPAFAYSPGMMHSPLAPEGRAMNGMMMGPPQINGHPMPPPPPPFQHPGMHPLGMPMMPPPPMPGGPGFPADAMHAAMGAVGFMRQRQAFHGGTELTKADFSRQFTELLQNDPEFMDVLYANYKNVFARR